MREKGEEGTMRYDHEMVKRKNMTEEYVDTMETNI